MKTGAGVYEVERILERRRKKGDFEYKVKWKGYAADNTWEPQRHLEDCGCKTLLQEFNTAYDKRDVHSHHEEGPEEASEYLARLGLGVRFGAGTSTTAQRAGSRSLVTRRGSVEDCLAQLGLGGSMGTGERF